MRRQNIVVYTTELLTHLLHCPAGVIVVDARRCFGGGTFEVVIEGPDCDPCIEGNEPRRAVFQEIE